MTMEENDELAEGMKRKLDKFDVSLNNLDATLKPFLNISANDIQDKIPDPLLKARLDLMVAYSINSLFWAYLTTQGVNPKQHPIRNELKRVQEYMTKVKLAEEKKKMARVDTHAAKRFVRNALWQAPQASTSTSNDTPPPEQTVERVKEDSEDTEEFEAPAAKRLKQDENTAEPETSTTSSETKKKSKKKKSKKEKKEKKEKKKKKDDSD